jgi:SAM-dependent methyltransferase
MAHAHDTVDWAELGPELIGDAEVNAPMVDQALEWLAERVPDAALVLDVGSGPGVAACRFAELLPAATVLAADGAGPLLALARERAQRLGVADRVETREVKLPDGLADLPRADVIWVSGVAHHLPDPAAGVRAFADLLRPGGVLALREGGLPLQCLPSAVDGGLTARIAVVDNALSRSHAHPMGAIVAPRSWPELLAEAGLIEVRSRSFLLDLPAPLPDAARRQLARMLRRTREMLADHLAADDLAQLAVLTDPDDPESVLHRADVFMLRAATVHTAARSGTRS